MTKEQHRGVPKEQLSFWPNKTNETLLSSSALKTSPFLSLPKAASTLIVKPYPFSTLELPTTPSQIRSIARMCSALGITEPLEERVSNRMEARNLMYDLRGED